MSTLLMLQIIAIVALLFIIAILRVRRRALVEEAALLAYLAELRLRREQEQREIAAGSTPAPYPTRRFGDMSRTAT